MANPCLFPAELKAWQGTMPANKSMKRKTLCWSHSATFGCLKDTSTTFAISCPFNNFGANGISFLSLEKVLSISSLIFNGSAINSSPKE